MKHFSSIVITGASSGIGAALAEAYAAPSVKICLFGRNAKRLNAIARTCTARGALVVAHACDVREQETLRTHILAFDTQHPIDLVIANAGISAGLGNSTESEEQVREVFAINVDGVLNTVLPILPRMQQRKRGHIALMSSLAGLRGLPSCPAYSASKNAVRAFGEGLRGAYQEHGITVSVICPGYIRTPMTDTNVFPMPFIMSAQKAAQKIQRGLALSRSRIAFPLALYLPLWLLTCLSVRLTDPFFAALPRKSSLPKNEKI